MSSIFLASSSTIRAHSAAVSTSTTNEGRRTDALRVCSALCSGANQFAVNARLYHFLFRLCVEDLRSIRSELDFLFAGFTALVGHQQSTHLPYATAIDCPEFLVTISSVAADYHGTATSYADNGPAT